MRVLFIHIGHDKTGSSYLQSHFARNQKTLAKHGFTYPVGEASRRAAVRGMATSGTQNDNTLEQRLADTIETNDVLLSYEGFFNRLAEHPNEEIERWQRWCDTLCFDKIKVLLFVRDPVSHASSTYLQMVRAEGHYGDLDAYVARYNRPLIVWNVLNTLKKASNIDVTVHSYSREKSKLLELTLNWLSPDREIEFDLKRQDELVNRGMTDEEVIVALRANRRSPSWGSNLAKLSLVQRPKLKSTLLIGSHGAQEVMVANNRHAMKKVNDLVGIESGYQIDFQEPRHAEANSLALFKALSQLMLAVGKQSLRQFASRLKGRLR
ncbi:hypothetical protein [Parasedimentitalea psychrophila]|uniref:Sulfotransferase family protein n=1 Tax=Parasedimentitalea psychrophila TaxID=2997337 RepID=A0A9Y2KXN8_9RHOB|nr:hypothetical protein [Parasedimentitalea psychrophila]WIY24568.1 hypothetical protein QPJ95_18885 [Parasedimentitalea psychrophila]